jgi:23S rRNA (pseudouridine1915-N3)-methyltransferase
LERREFMLMEIVAVTRGLPKEEQALLRRYGVRMRGWLEVRTVRTESAALKVLEEKMRRGWQTVMMDERGEDMGSREVAERVCRARDEQGFRGIRFVIGGSEGLLPRWREEVDWSWCFGRVTWPHHLMQVMLAEQLYRVRSIMEGHPYHRE